MADEEVDWGMEDSVDVWRQGGNVAVGDNEDAISLDGMEGESEAKPTTVKPSNSQRLSTSRPPPTGPRKPIRRGDESNSQQGNGNVSAGPLRGRLASDAAGTKADVKVGNGAATTTPKENGVGASLAKQNATASEATTSAPSKQTSVQNQSQQEPAAAVEPLPEGWTEVFSRTQKAVFYHNKLTSETSWVRPRMPQPKIDDVEDRPVTPPPAAASSTNGTKAAANASNVAPSKPTAQVVTSAIKAGPVTMKQDRAPPTGPGGAEKKATAPVDPVQSAYAGRRTVKASRESRPSSAASVRAPAPTAGSARPEDRGVKRSPSPRREEPKRTKMEDQPSQLTILDRVLSINPPAGPRLSAPGGRGPRSPGRLPSDDKSQPERREAPRTDDRASSRPTQTSRPLVIARGSNSAPLTMSKWGARPEAAPTTATTTIVPPASIESREPARAPYGGREAPAPALSRTTSAAEDAADKRARLREEARRAEETLRKIKEEEDRLEREDIDERRKRLDEADRRRREEDRFREDDDRRRRDDDWRRDDEHSRRGGAERERQIYSPERLRHDDRSYRPPASPPPRGPPPSNRLDGPGQPAGLRDVRRARPDSPSRIDRRTSPSLYPTSRPRSRSPSRPSSRYPRGPSPPRRNGDSYYPDVEPVGDRDRRGPAVSLAARIGRTGSRQPEISAESMRGRPRSPPPIGRGSDSFRRDSQPAASAYRPLAERMSRGAKDPRDGWNGKNVIARRM